MNRIILIRHGETHMNSNGCFLGDIDVELSEDLVTADKIKNLTLSLKSWTPKISVIVSSPLRRATQTAKIIADFLNIDTLDIYSDLREISFGDWEGKKREEIDINESKEWCDRNASYNTRAKNGETLGHVSDRIEKILNDLCVKYNNTVIVIVTHVYVIKAALDRAMNVADGFHANRLWLDTASATIMDWSLDSTKRIVHRVNWTPDITSGVDKWNKLNK